MRKLVLLAAIAALFLLAIPVGSAGAVSLFEAVEIEVETSFFDDMPSNGPFEASGPAVDAGLICESGWAVDGGFKASPREGSLPGTNYQVYKVFLCGYNELPNPEVMVDDGFVLKLQVRLDKKGDNYSWNLMGGWGLYEELRGHGHGFGVYFADPTTGVTDYFSGVVR